MKQNGFYFYLVSTIMKLILLRYHADITTSSQLNRLPRVVYDVNIIAQIMINCMLQHDIVTCI